MALSSRAHAFSVEALVGRPSKRKLQERREEAQPELLEKEGGEEEERGSGAGRKSKPAEKRPKKEPSATAFSGCGGGGNSSESLGENDAIQVELQGFELWKRFHDIGTEMIITKAGRRMFPSVRVKVKGLDPGKQYCVAIDVVPVDSKRYRYVYHSSQWMVAGNTDHSCITPRFYVHPDSPCSGETWMRQIISFDRVKLTNNEMDDKGHIILQSMHKYKPRVHVMEQDSRVDLSWIQSLPAEGVKTFSFKETEFTTVTAYQNQQITRLKIDRNPFAKGFRDPGRNRGVLEGFLETYPWRPSLTLDFKTFGADTQSGSSGSSPVTSSGGAPSPLNSLLSPPCSPPTFHLPTSSLGMPCPEVYLHNINLPLCYKICPTNFWRQQSLVLPAPERLASSSSSQSLSPLMKEVPMLSSLGVANSKNGSSTDFSGQCVQAPNSSNQMYGLQAPGNILSQNPIAQEAIGCSFHPSFGFYRYSFSLPSRLVNAPNHLKVNDNSQVSFREGKCNHAHWYPTINHCL
ncbi:T-box transcription factor 22 [Rhinolophus ferrumequinum]|uniref:T-box transcription factor 22 n=1 Tax=Rhinolophus ferrumequinum TaxID=59479 RepID=A0A7J8AXB7_RHIFE|nr:T-box transcription factor TBX22 [Rhinolophus ferrumequinum]KAF6390931.1 T-box transcription factor 22 [Rhinolophus ferrumequinum]